MAKDRITQEDIKAAKVKFLGKAGVDAGMALRDIVDIALSTKKDMDRVGKNMEAFKKFFKEIGEVGDSFYGEAGEVSLLGRATSTVDPIELEELLISVGRGNEFIGMVSVKIADARNKLGTMLFDKVATTDPNASITVKMSRKK